MSPVAQPVVLDLRKYQLRHIGPAADVWPTALGAAYTVLQCSTMVARPIPVQNLPNSPDFASGKWTGRLNDAGDFTLTWPNTVASDGLPWRDRFDPTGHLQWLEIKIDEHLEANVVVVKTDTLRDHIDVSGFDGFFLLKKVYMRDWIVTCAPRDVIERGTRAWVPLTADGFPGPSLSSQWTPTTGTGGSMFFTPSGGLVLVSTASIGSFAQVASAAIPTTSLVWDASVETSAPGSALRLTVTETGGAAYSLTVFPVPPGYDASFAVNGSQVVIGNPTSAPSFSIRMESDGRWIWSFCNGQLMSVYQRSSTAITALQTTIKESSSGNAGFSVLTGAKTRSLQPFLMRGSDQGDYVLPGNASTYPSGGLYARYYNDLDLQSDANRLNKILNPSRSQAYQGSGAQEYLDQQDADINGQANPQGAASSNWSCKWFGAIWLELAAGDYRMGLQTATVGVASRVWIGQTAFGTQLVDQWTFAVGSGGYNFTASASGLAGTLSSGATVQRTGWYPIVVEYAVDSTPQTAPSLVFTNVPVGYTDPGGTAIAAGAQSTVVPSSSLSPLGCIDNRYQGTSHFDLVQQTCQAVGYQAALEPQPLESGLFPGTLAPRLREDQDWDVILEPDNRAVADPIINYGATVDATDQASSFQGNGAGFQNGSTGQLQGEVYDPGSMLAGLFDIQGWQDSSDASYASLLQALLNSELSLRLEPWEIVSGDPFARMRLADTWPLSGVFAQMRWRPGAGVQVRARDINVDDVTPRQLLLVTRNISPNGAVSTQVGFAARPKSDVYSFRQALRAAIRPQRNYQRRQGSLTGNLQVSTVTAGATDTNSTAVSLDASETVVHARVRITVLTGGTANIVVNGTDQTTAFGGPWAGSPLTIDITAVATSSSGLLAVQIKANANTIGVRYQVLVDVLR